MAPTITVVFDHLAAVYFPGQTVTGHVQVTNNKSRPCEGISVKFKGSAFVSFQETVSVGQGKDRKTETRTYIATEEYYKSQYLVWTDPSQELQPGSVQFPFSFIIPANTPASYVSRYGNVTHYCEATIRLPGLSKDVFCKRPYSVNAILDLNLDPANKATQLRQGMKSLCCLCCRSGPITAVVRIDRTGYVPGEPILVSGEVTNNSNRKVRSTTAELVMIVTFIAVGRNKVEHYRLMRLDQPEIPKGGDCVWNGHGIQIPPLPASGLVGCNIINIHYVLKFFVQPQLPATPMVLDFPITIGTIPLRETFQDFYAQPQSFPSTVGFAQPSTSGFSPPLAPADEPPAYSPPIFPGMEQYPTMPPPSYGHSVSSDLKAGPSDLNSDEGQQPSAPAMDFTPTYVSYTLSSGARKG